MTFIGGCWAHSTLLYYGVAKWIIPLFYRSVDHDCQEFLWTDSKLIKDAWNKNQVMKFLQHATITKCILFYLDNMNQTLETNLIFDKYRPS